MTSYSTTASMNIETQEAPVFTGSQTLPEMIDADSDNPVDPSKIRHRVSVRDSVYNQLKAESKRLGKPVVELATQAIEEYLEKLKVE